MKKVKVYRPGKLFIAGEYSVVESGRKAIIASVDRFISVEIKESKKAVIKSFDGEKLFFTRTDQGLVFDSQDPKWAYISSALTYAEKYLSATIKTFENYEITVESQMDDKSGKKYGLGSSAAVSVALVDALFKYYGKELSNEQLFKLVALSTLDRSPNNSCGDIAAIVYNKVVYYKKFDRDFLFSKKKIMSIYDLVDTFWPLLEIKSLDFPEKWSFLVGWTQIPASSFDLVNKIKQEAKYKASYIAFQNESDRIVEMLIKTLKNEDFVSFKALIGQARENLLNFARTFSTDIEIKELKILSDLAIDIGYASKLSGAGGGDCGIAIADKDINDQKLIQLWADSKIKYLDINIYKGEENA